MFLILLITSLAVPSYCFFSLSMPLF